MSEIYSKASTFLNKLAYTIKNSFFINLIFTIALKIEELWVNSFFKSLYPSENFLSFILKINILKKNIFCPLIVLVVFAVFLLLSLTLVNSSLQITLLIAFISFFIGAAIIPYFLLNNSDEKPLISFPYEDLYSIGFGLIIIGVVFFFISVATVGGVPILKPSLRYSLKPMFTMPVFLMIPGVCILASVYVHKFKNNILTRSQARFRFMALIAFSGVFMVGLGYRTHLLAILLVMIILGYYGEIFAVWEVVIGTLICVAAIIGIGYYRAMEEFAISTVSPFYSLQNRADFTLGVLNKIDLIGGNFGVTHGQVIAGSIPGSSLSPRMLIGKLIDWRTAVSVTPTLIGQMVADFGKVGVAFGMCLFGFILGTGFKIMRKTKNYFFMGLYALILTYAILGVETGILDIQILLYHAIALILYLIYIAKSYSTK